MGKSNGNGLLIFVLIIIFVPLGAVLLLSGAGLIMLVIFGIALLFVNITTSIEKKKKNRKNVKLEKLNKEREAILRNQQLENAIQEKKSKNNDFLLFIENNNYINNRIDTLIDQVKIISNRSIEEQDEYFEEDYLVLHELNSIAMRMTPLRINSEKLYAGPLFLWLSCIAEINSSIFKIIDSHAEFIFATKIIFDGNDLSSLTRKDYEEYLFLDSKTLSPLFIESFESLDTEVEKYFEKLMPTELMKFSAALVLDSNHCDELTTREIDLIRSLRDGYSKLSDIDESLSKSTLKELRLKFKNAIKVAINIFVSESRSYSEDKYEAALYRKDDIGSFIDLSVKSSFDSNKKNFKNIMNQYYTNFERGKYSNLVEKINYSYFFEGIEKEDSYKHSDLYKEHFSSLTNNKDTIEYGLKKIDQFYSDYVISADSRVSSKSEGIADEIFEYTFKEYVEHFNYKNILEYYFDE